jgi:hypothetical protein
VGRISSPTEATTELVEQISKCEPGLEGFIPSRSQRSITSEFTDNFVTLIIFIGEKSP